MVMLQDVLYPEMDNDSCSIGVKPSQPWDNTNDINSFSTSTSLLVLILYCTPPWRTGGDHWDAPILRGWRLPSRTWNQWTSPWTKQLTWLTIVHSGYWCLRLALRTNSGTWLNEWVNETLSLTHRPMTRPDPAKIGDRDPDLPRR